MTTEAGRRLLDEEWDNFGEPWGSMADHVAAIEAEARAALLAELEAGVEGLLDSPALYPEHMGPTIRKENDVVRAVLDLIRKAAKP